jgi:DNA-binding PadR family transcriptional regulator
MSRDWASEFESRFHQHGRSWGGWQGGPPGRRGGGGPPPWLTGLFGLARPEPARGPRVRRGDVRVAVLAVLAEGPLNGYQVIQEISGRTQGAWRPSPGSIYPTISQLEDEGLLEGDDERGRRTLRLSKAGRAFLDEHADEVEEVWAPFTREREEHPAHAEDSGGDSGPDFGSLKPELGRVMNAVWQIITTGTDDQRRAAVGVLVEARRGLYQILADHPGDEEGEQ